VHYTLIEYPELKPDRLLLVRLHWTEQRLNAAEATASGITGELVALERKLQIRLADNNVMQGSSRPTLLGQVIPWFSWNSLRCLWPFLVASTATRQTCRFTISAFSWRWAALANAVTAFWRKS